MASRLAQMQARFQQKQMQEKEEKLLKLYENQQQRTIERVSRGSAGSDVIVTTTTTFNTLNGTKTKQTLDDRRQKAGIDRSYPLEPLKKTNGLLKRNQNPDQNRNLSTKFTGKSTVQKSVTQLTNGKPNKRDLSQTIHHNGKLDYEEIHNEDDNANEIFDQRNDLVLMMNNHNLEENLDDEELPNIELDICEVSSGIGILPSVIDAKISNQKEKVVRKKTEQKLSITGKMPASPIRNQAKTFVRKTVLPTPSSSKHTPSGNIRTTNQLTKTSTPTTPNKQLTMSGKPKQNASAGSRVPSTNRPSARQTPKASAQSAVARDDLASCRYCNRRFASDRLQVHEDICARTGKKKRKTYDATKHRVQGTELEPFVRKNVKMPSSKARPSSAKKGNWRQTHEEFISTIRAAKMAQQHIAKGGKLSDLPPPPPSSNPDYVQCPHCGRKFNETAAERHIPKCATYQYNKPKAPPGRQPPNKVSGRGSYR